MKNPEYQRKMSEMQRARWVQGAYDNRDMSARWEDPDYHRKMSEIVKAQWEDPEYRRKQSSKKSKMAKAKAMKARWKNPKYRRKMSKMAKARWAQGDLGNSEWRRKNSEAIKAKWEQGVYDDVFQSPTSIELKITAALDICGIEHVSQYRPNEYGRVFDEFVPPNILIEVHGDYWHGPEKPKVQKRDIEKAAWAKKHNYSLVVIWEYEIKEQGAWALIHERILPLL